MKSALYILLILLNLANAGELHLSDVPVQESGRIKPLHTFAKNQLLSIHHKSYLKDYNQSAISWFMQLLIDPENSYKKHIFKIKNNEVLSALNISERESKSYSYNEISKGINDNIEYFMGLHSSDSDSFNSTERQLSDLFIKSITYKNLSRSFTCLIPQVEIVDTDIADALGTTVGAKHSYAFFVLNFGKLVPLIKEATKSDRDIHKSLETTIQKIDSISKDSYSKLLKIIPSEDESRPWISIWELLDGREISDSQMKLTLELENYISGYMYKDFELQSQSIERYIQQISGSFKSVDMGLIKQETSYNKYDLFYYSLILYLLSFLILGLSWILNSDIMQRASYYVVIAGLSIHGYGIIMRMIIMQRPPVSTLYESIIFVCFVSVLFSCIFERFRKDGIGILLGSIIGVCLHFVGFGYADDGDTLGVLVAVLNSNFWLATHVTTITVGYGATALASLMGHVYMIIRLLNQSSRKFLKQMNTNMISLNLVALFFMLFGTILGGIWADQSWGRFWGWDPKENAALMIVMWQLLMVHLRISGMIKPLEFALGMVMNNIFLAFGWFGVNLLGVGLHSYGFTDSIATNLAVFILFELWFGLAFYFLIKDTVIKKL